MFIRYVFNSLKEENDPARDFDRVLEERYDGQIYDYLTEYFCDMIYDANEFSFEDFCNRFGASFENCVEYLQDFVKGITDFELVRLCLDDINIEPIIDYYIDYNSLPPAQ